MDSKRSQKINDNMKKSLVFKFEDDENDQVLCINLTEKDVNFQQSNNLFKSKLQEKEPSPEKKHIRNFSQPQQNFPQEHNRDLKNIGFNQIQKISEYNPIIENQTQLQDYPLNISQNQASDYEINYSVLSMGDINGLDRLEPERNVSSQDSMQKVEPQYQEEQTYSQQIYFEKYEDNQFQNSFRNSIEQESNASFQLNEEQHKFEQPLFLQHVPNQTQSIFLNSDLFLQDNQKSIKKNFKHMRLESFENETSYESTSLKQSEISKQSSYCDQSNNQESFYSQSRISQLKQNCFSQMEELFFSIIENKDDKDFIISQKNIQKIRPKFFTPMVQMQSKNVDYTYIQNKLSQDKVTQKQEEAKIQIQNLHSQKKLPFQRIIKRNINPFDQIKDKLKEANKLNFFENYKGISKTFRR